MNGNQRHARYRRQVYRRRRIRMILILSALLVLLLVIGFLILGNLLKKDQEPTDDSEPTETEETVTDRKVSLPSALMARYTLLETTDSSTLSGRLRSLQQANATGASVPMNRPDGAMLYRSSVAASLGSGSDVYSVTVTQAVKQAKDYGLRLCGIWYLSAPDGDNDLLYSVERAETAAILAEALRAGMDDILLIAPTLDKDAIPELTLLAEEVRRLAPEGALGFCLSEPILEDKKADVWVDDLANAFDFLAINAADFGAEDPVAHVESVASGHLDGLLRYRMRLLLPVVEDSALEDAIIAAAKQYSAKSWQMVAPME